MLHENQQLSRVGTQFRLDIVTLMHQTSLGRHLHPRSHRLLTPRAPRVSEKYICDRISFSLRSIFSSFSRRDETSAKTRVRKKIAGCTYGYYREHTGGKIARHGCLKSLELNLRVVAQKSDARI